jgi:hypothetical protein
MSERKGLFARAVERLRGGPPTSRNESVERGPLTHGDDGYLHASGISRRDDGHIGRERTGRDIERDRESGPAEELDRGYGDRRNSEI